MKLALALLLPVGLATCVPVEKESQIRAAASTSGLETGALFVANKRGNSLSKIDLVSGEEVKRVDSCANPHELATSPDGRHVALACYGGSSIDIFLTSTLARVESIDLREIDDAPDASSVFSGSHARPHGIFWHESGTIYATAEGRQSIFSLTDAARGPIGISEYKTGKSGSHMLAVAPDQRAAWTTDLGSKTVTRIDLKGGEKPQSVTVGVEPEGIALLPDGKALWVSARGSDKAIELDPITLRVRREVDTGRFPLRLVIRPQGDVAVTSNLADGSLSVIDLGTAKVTRTIAVSSVEEAQTRKQVTILWSVDGERIYVAETGTDTVAEVDYASGKVLRRLATGEGGDGLAILQ